MQLPKAAAGAGAGAARFSRTPMPIVANAVPVTQERSSSVQPAVAPLFTPFKMGRFELAHRMVYAPLTRNRANKDNVPQPIMAEYYAQRATAGGLMVTEATVINDNAAGYPCVSGVWTTEQVEAWKPVVKAVHDKGAVFFCQLWHCGRVAHPEFTNGRTPVSASALTPSGQIWLAEKGMGDYVVPQALDKAGIQAAVNDYRMAARNAIAAGFDGVEIHGANGYLIDQFTKSSTNNRTDEYGGSIENRCRFALEVVEAVVAEIGADRVGIRLSPFTTFLDATDDKPYETFTYLVEQLNKFKLANIHMVEGRIQGNAEVESAETLEPFRKVWQGPFITAGGFTAETGAEAVASGHADLVAYGRLWIANPDLPKRFQLGAPLNKYDRDTFYGGGAKGYIDYPFLEDN